MNQGEPGAKGIWLPALVGVLLCALALALWRMLEQQEDANLRAKVRSESDYLASHIEADLRNRIPALERMATSWELRGGAPEVEFVGEARSYLSDVPGFQALEWVDDGSIVRRIVPLEGNEKALGLNLAFEKNRREAMAKARYAGSPAMTLPVSLVQGGTGFLVFFPIHRRGEFDGYVLAVFRIREWLDYVFSFKGPGRSSEDFRISVLFDEEAVYEQAGWAGLARNDTGIVSVARILDHELKVRARPGDGFIKANESFLPQLVALVGCLGSLIAAFIVRLYQRGHAETARAHAARKALEAEILERERVELELQRVLLRMDMATKAGRMGVWTWDLSTDKLTWNDRMFELLDLPSDVEPTYEIWRDAIHPEDRAQAESLIHSAVLGKAVFDTEFRYLLFDGAIRTIRAAARVERDPEGKPKSMTGLNWDVSEAKRAEAALKRSEEKVRLLLDSTGEAIYGIDLEGDCSFANPACARMLGYPGPETLLGKNMHRLIHHSYPDGTPMPVEDCRIYQAFREGRPLHVDDEVLWRPDGSSFPAEYWSYPQVAHGEVSGAVVAFVDITERRKTEETIRHMATHDALTDLPSLRLYRDRLAMAMSAARRNKTLAAVLFLDLDGFKAVNDTYGHDAGDEVLREAAKRLRSALRDMDTVARMGGDEFLLAITEAQSAEGAASIAEKALRLLSLPILYKSQDISIGASIGIALFPRDADSVEGLIQLADQAMYRVKKSGKGGFRFAGDEDGPKG